LTRPTNISTSGGTSFSVSDNGMLVWQGDRSHDYQFVWFDRAGRQVGTAGPPTRTRVGQGPRFSTDGKRVVFQRVDPESREMDIWVIDSASNLPTRLATERGFKSSPIWSPDGSRVVYGGRYDLYQKNASGVGAVEVVLKGETNEWNYAPTDWTPDGRFLLYSRFARKTQRDMLALPMTSVAQPYPLLNTEFDEHRAQLSPDGAYLAYVSNELGSNEIYVQPFTADGKLGGDKRRISTAGGDQPRWRRDGRELFYVAADGRMMAVGVKTNGATFEPGTPTALFKTRMLSATVQSSIDYDVTADGQRFLIGTLIGEATPVSVILNWTAEVKPK
ncbi:MAG: hypothetical protein M3Q32_09625, partial [Pseudomonadota bacterium]|nr:hypothetical protein [Pseudomonadota bacterium]